MASRTLSGRRRASNSTSSDVYNPHETLTTPSTATTTFHLYTFQQLRPRTTKWHQTLWVAASDVTISDTVEHSCMWMAFCVNKVLRSHTYRCFHTFFDKLRATVHTDVKCTQFHLKRRSSRLSTLLFISLLQHIMILPPERCNRDNHGVRLAEHGCDTIFSFLRFADDIIHISRSPKHTTTMQDHLITAIPAHGLQLHPVKSISNKISSARKNSTVAVQWNLEILPLDGEIKYLGQLITFQHSVQVVFDHRVNCAWAAFTSH